MLEIGARRVFAAAVDWPGWCRSGRDVDAALQALVDYLPRYQPVVRRAGLTLVVDDLNVVEELEGNTTTDFGAPGQIARKDHRRVPKPEGQRLASLVEASWATLDTVARSAPASLRKGPRGGGRDRDKVVRHVLEAELSYARKIDVPLHPADLKTRQTIAEARAQVIDRLARWSDGSPLAENGWPLRYAARRFAWHALDHAWEIQDRS